jgi:hypothetical protein
MLLSAGDTPCRYSRSCFCLFASRVDTATPETTLARSSAVDFPHFSVWQQKENPLFENEFDAQQPDQD